MSRIQFASGSALFVSALLLAGCNTDPGKGKAHATVAEAASVAAPLAPAAPTGSVRYVFSNDGSKLGFVGAKVTAKHEGSFSKFNGTVQIPDGDASKGQVSFEVETASVVIDPEKLAGHLKSADFLDVEKIPKATFTSTAVKAGGENGATHTITGNLSLHGVTKAISFPATVKASPDSVDVDAEFAINRKDFAIVYAGKADDLIRDDVLIQLKIRAKKA